MPELYGGDGDGGASSGCFEKGRRERKVRRGSGRREWIVEARGGCAGICRGRREGGGGSHSHGHNKQTQHNTTLLLLLLLLLWVSVDTEETERDRDRDSLLSSVPPPYHQFFFLIIYNKNEIIHIIKIYVCMYYVSMYVCMYVSMYVCM